GVGGPAGGVGQVDVGSAGGLFGLAHDLGQPPVEQHRLAVGAEHHGVRLQVAVNHAPAVGGGARLGKAGDPFHEPEALDFAGRARGGVGRVVFGNGVLEGPGP